VRSLAEIRFRLKQELVNAACWAFPPSVDAPVPDEFFPLPSAAGIAARLKKTRFQASVEALAEAVCRRELPVMGTQLRTPPEIDWRRDYIHGISAPARYSRLLPYLDFARVGDHKTIWEINRHQHIVLLVQAWLLTERGEFLDDACAQLTGWLETNPMMRGINWCSALEVAFRAVSWIWILHLAGPALPGALKRRMVRGLYQHGRHLEHNLSWYFSPNTHLLGEATALHAIGALFPSFPGASRWQETGHAAVVQQMKAQVHADGSHNEQSTYYHVYALDMFLFHAILSETPDWYRDKLRLMADYLAAVMGRERAIPLLGDDDGGRWFYPFGERTQFGRATLASCVQFFRQPLWPCCEHDFDAQAVWWLPEIDGTLARAGNNGGSRFFPDAGIAIMTARGAEVIVDAGPFGRGSGGHSHSDTLSVLARRDGQEVLVDAGTYTYVTDPRWREWFRGSAAHNTVRIDGHNQAVASGPFRWLNTPDVAVLEWSAGGSRDVLDAAVRFAGFEHRRRLEFYKDTLVVVICDDVSGPPGEHVIECFWHAGNRDACQRLLFAPGERLDLHYGGEHGWCSHAFGEKHPAPALCLTRETTLPARIWTILDLSDAPPKTMIADQESCRYGDICVRASPL
jgi:hypothetical protein